MLAISVNSIAVGSSREASLEMVGEYLIVCIEISLAFHKNGSGSRIKFIERMNKPRVHRFLQTQERSWCDGNSRSLNV